MSADTIFALVASVLGVPTLGYGLQVDFRSRAQRRRRHLRLLRRAVDEVEAAALNLLRTDLSGPGLKSPRLVAPRKRLYRAIDDLSRQLDGDLTPEFVWALNPGLLRTVSAAECAERLDGVSAALGLLLSPLTRADRRHLRATGELAPATALERLLPPLAWRRDRLRGRARRVAGPGAAIAGSAWR